MVLCGGERGGGAARKEVAGEFPQEVEGEEDGQEGEGIRGGGDDGGRYHEGYDGVSPEAREKAPVEQPDAPQGPGQDRDFKGYSHDEEHGHEVVDIGVKGYGVGDVGRQLVTGKKAEGQGEYQPVGHGHAEKEKRVPGHEGCPGIASFPRIKGRGHEAPQDIDQQRKGHYDRKLARQGQMDEKLRGQLGVDEADMKIGGGCRGVAPEGRKAVEGRIKRERAVARGQNHRIENPRHGDEYGDSGHENCRAHPEQHGAEGVEMFPECHFLVVAHELSLWTGRNCNRGVVAPEAIISFAPECRWYRRYRRLSSLPRWRR